MIAAEMLTKDRRLAHRGVSANHCRKKVEARLVAENDGPTLLQRPLSEKAPRVKPEYGLYPVIPLRSWWIASTPKVCSRDEEA